jgi:hypothetical protein
MSNYLYDKGRQAFLEGSIAYLTDTIKVGLVTSTYSASQSADQFWSTPVANVVGTPGTLASKASTSGVASAANLTFTAVTGSAVSQLIIYKDTGSNATSPLIAHIDTATGLPVTPNGGDITIAWDTGANKIFKL